MRACVGPAPCAQEQPDSAPAGSKAVHAFALGSIALCTILLIAPAPYHRIVFAGEVTRTLCDLGSRLIMVATLALTIGLAADIVVIAKIAHSVTAGLAAAAACIVLVALSHISLCARLLAGGASHAPSRRTPPSAGDSPSHYALQRCWNLTVHRFVSPITDPCVTDFRQA
jgi:hypothetical protein